MEFFSKGYFSSFFSERYFPGSGEESVTIFQTGFLLHIYGGEEEVTADANANITGILFHIYLGDESLRDIDIPVEGIVADITLGTVSVSVSVILPFILEQYIFGGSRSKQKEDETEEEKSFSIKKRVSGFRLSVKLNSVKILAEINDDDVALTLILTSDTPKQIVKENEEEILLLLNELVPRVKQYNTSEEDLILLLNECIQMPQKDNSEEDAIQTIIQLIA